jgi:hypothetical protein
MKKEDVILREWHCKDFITKPGDIIEYLKLSIKEDTLEEFLESIKDIINSKYLSDKKFKTFQEMLDSIGFELCVVKKTKRKEKQNKINKIKQ